MYQEKERKGEKGITLIALIITIIVLLILAGVSLNAVVGENGILNRATEASKKTNDAKAEEERQFAMAEAAMNFENTEYEDEKGNKVTIPAGFAVSQVEGENTVEDGLVIIDSNGNEFVWIPVNNIDEYKKTFFCGSESLTLDDCKDRNLPSGITSEQEQIKKNKGFYIGRYEVGRSENVDSVTSTTSYDKDMKAIVKYGAQPWTFLSYETVQTKSTEFLNTDKVKSGLVTGTQWDYIMGMAKNKGYNIESDSSLWGTFSSSYDIVIAKGGRIALENKSPMIWKEIQNDYLKPKDTVLYHETGANRNAKFYNIYDLAGNVWEYTNEEYIIRGGHRWQYYACCISCKKY